ncbi:MAG: substrate-binding domain-containing protein [Lachnospiraceae bacterium]|nr:substrate-binding domain-containing protein [Lachnospiraceae bacterium]
MKIAVLLGGIGYDSQKRTVSGILDRAILDRTNVYIFTCDGWKYEVPAKYEKGEYNIYNLPDFTKYDGVILNTDTIHEPDIVQEIADRINVAGVPCIDLNINTPWFVHVEMENRHGVEEIVRHLVTQHKAANIFFISGPEDSHDANGRLSAYKDTMAENDIEWDEGYIYYGDYSYESGQRAVRKFSDEAGVKPDAIVAANDEMAVGAMLALKEAGYRVPEDVMVTGYDDSDIAIYSYPRLTTVRRGEYEAGQIAYDKIVAMIRGEEVEDNTIIQGHAMFAESCGCADWRDADASQMRENYMKQHVKAYREMEIIKNSSVEFTRLTQFDDLLESLEQYIHDIGIEYFYLCTCGSLDNYYRELERIADGEERGRDASIYSDEIWVPFAYERGEINSYGAFHKSMLLPEECMMKHAGAFYIIMPLHFQDHCFGYCVARDYRPALEGRFYQNFILNVDNAMEMIQKQDMMKAMLQRSNKKLSENSRALDK